MWKLNEIEILFSFNIVIIIAIDLGFQVCGFLYSVTGMFLGGGI
jgi:hypothetical protein